MPPVSLASILHRVSPPPPEEMAPPPEAPVPTWSDLPREVHDIVRSKLGLRDSLNLRATDHYARDMHTLSDEVFDKEIWSTATPAQARKMVTSINKQHGTTRSHPILDIDAAIWDTCAFCASALELGHAQEGWQVLAWARANGCPWSPVVREAVRILTVPDGVAAVLPNGIFHDCASLTSVRLPAGIVALPRDAFSLCPALTSVELPPGLAAVGDDCFRGCTALPSIRLPGSVATLGHRTFYRCTRLASVQMSPGLAAVGDDCFRDCTDLPSIRLPGSVATLGHRAFYGCTRLASVQMSPGLAAVGNDCFRYCTALPSILLPDSITTLGARIFWGCIALTSVHLPGELRSIGENPFHGCSNLTKVVVPERIPRGIKLKLYSYLPPDVVQLR